jgi:HSP20 family protein
MFDLARWEPFDGLNLINHFLEDGWQRPQTAPAAVWYPPVDILESKDSYLIRAELPGMKREDFNLELNEGVLTLSGERKAEEPAEGVEYHRTERLAGKFSRSFHLPQTVAQDGIKATYRDGILEVYVPKAEEAKPKKITVNVN